jgi:hypothetical protein
MIRNALFASMIALAGAGVAQAQDRGPHLVGGGENAQVTYGAPSGNIVGGGFASLSGGANNLRITYGPDVAAEAANGTVARLVGGGDNEQVIYDQVAPAVSFLADRTVRPPRG